MLIQITPKKIHKGYEVSATFEHQGCQYEERFNKKHHFMSKVKRTKDQFICAVDYTQMKVLYPLDIQKGLQ